MKTCSKCGIEKPLTDFNKDKVKKDGLQYRCKTCNKKYLNEYNKTDKAKQSVLNYFYKVCGVYQIIDDNTNECLYVGKSWMFNHRKTQHQNFIQYPEKSPKHKKLYYSLKKHNSVSIKIVKECPRDMLLELEQHYRKLLKPKYN
jgi:hypothetical protein